LTEKIGEIILGLFGGERPDVIHIQSISDFAVFVTRWAKKQGIRVVLTEHILFVRHEINRLSKLRENLYNEVDEVMCVSNYLYRNLLTSGFKMKHVSVIGNLVNDKYIQQDRISKKNGRVLFVANHYHDKGLDILFEVIKQLQNKIDCVVDIVGLDGTSQFNKVSTIDDMVKKYDIERNICLLGKIAHDDLLKLYSQYSVLLSTSTSETFGLAVAEAIMYGTKVVCTDSGGIRDFVNDKNGIVVGLNNAGELVDAIIKSLEDSIEPAVEQCKLKGLEVNSDNVVKEHVMQDIQELMEQDHDLVKYMKEHKVKIVPAYYHLDTGKVDFLK
jgi:glycosyltransferase involved in cell wall biosynthesis